MKSPILLAVIVVLIAVVGCAEMSSAQRSPASCVEHYAGVLYDCVVNEDSELCYDQFEHDIEFLCGLSSGSASRVTQKFRDNPPE